MSQRKEKFRTQPVDHGVIADSERNDRRKKDERTDARKQGPGVEQNLNQVIVSPFICVCVIFASLCLKVNESRPWKQQTFKLCNVFP